MTVFTKRPKLGKVTSPAGETEDKWVDFRDGGVSVSDLCGDGVVQALGLKVNSKNQLRAGEIIKVTMELKI